MSSVKLRFFFKVIGTDGDGAVDAGVGNVTGASRSDVSSRTRIRRSRDARTPVPWVLPCAEARDDVEAVVYVCCWVSSKTVSFAGGK
jgi:hypothetical protein